MRWWPRRPSVGVWVVLTLEATVPNVVRSIGVGVLECAWTQ